MAKGSVAVLALIAFFVGLGAGYFVFSPGPLNDEIEDPTESGNYCCDKISIGKKCIKMPKGGVCPQEKPLTISIP